MNRAEGSSYFAVKILYEGIFGHMTTFWIYFHSVSCNYADIECYKQSNNKLALVCFILKVNLCENLQKQQNETPSYFEWKP